MPEQQSWIVATEVVWPTKSELFTIGPSQKKYLPTPGLHVRELHANSTGKQQARVSRQNRHTSPTQLMLTHSAYNWIFTKKHKIPNQPVLPPHPFLLTLWKEQQQWILPLLYMFVGTWTSLRLMFTGKLLKWSFGAKMNSFPSSKKFPSLSLSFISTALKYSYWKRKAKTLHVTLGRGLWTQTDLGRGCRPSSTLVDPALVT